MYSKNNYEIYWHTSVFLPSLIRIKLAKVINNYIFINNLIRLYQIALSHINKYDLFKIIIKQYRLNIKKYCKFKINRPLNDKKKFKKL